MKRRFWWVVTDDRNSNEVNFMWTQLKVMDFYQRQNQAQFWFMNERVRKPDEIGRQSRELVKDVSR